MGGQRRKPPATANAASSAPGRRLTAWLPHPVQAALAAGTGLLLVLAYPNAGLWPLALVAHVPLLIALGGDDVRPRQAFVLGWISGFVLHATTFSWLSFTLIEMSDAPAPLAWLGVVAHGLAVGLHRAVWAWLLTRHWPGMLPRDTDGWWPVVRWVAAAASLWVAIEFTLPFLFPWYLGNALYPAPILLQVADLIGIPLVSALTMAVSLLAFAAWRLVGRARLLALAALVVLVALWTGYGAWALARIDAVPAERSFTGALVQANVTIAEKKALAPGPRIPMFNRVARLSETEVFAAEDDDKPDLLVWPEGALPFFFVPSELETPGRAPPVLLEITRRVLGLAERWGRPFLFGSSRRLDPQWQQRARNAAILTQPGTPRQIYDKQILVPFGEYLPGRDLLPEGFKVPGVSNMGAGDGPVRMVATSPAGTKTELGVNICYEGLFLGSMWSWMQSADVLINLTNDVWFGPGNASELHLMVHLARAVELRRPLWRATATGVTASIDAAGRVIARLPPRTEGVLRVDAAIRPLDSVFRHVGPVPVYVWVVAVWCLVVWRGRKSRQMAGEAGAQS